MPYLEYTDEDLVEAAKRVKSIAGLCRELGLKPVGGNYYTMKKKLQLLSVDTSHWTGQGWTKDSQLKDWSEYKNGERLKPNLIRLRGHQCESCKLREWLHKPISLEVHHINGDRTNNSEDNLQLLCPNCHSATDNWRGRKNKITNPKPKVKKEIFKKVSIEGYKSRVVFQKCLLCPNKVHRNSSKYCSYACSRKASRKIDWPSREYLIEEIEKTSYCAVARRLGVSDQAIHKHLKRHATVGR